MSRSPLALAAFAALTVLCTAPVSAAIISGPDIISPPTTLGPNPFGQDRVVAFHEQQNLTLGRNVDLGRKAARKVSRAGGSNAKLARTVEAGTVVSSHYVAYDPSGIAKTTMTIEFDSEILGVVIGDRRLVATDFLGADGVEYEKFRFRTREPRDKYKIGADGKSVTLKLRANSPGDHFRIITAGSDSPPPPPPPPPPSAPEPGAALLFGLGAAIVARRTSRRKPAAR